MSDYRPLEFFYDNPNLQLITENVNGEVIPKLKGEFGKCDIINENKRYYKRAIMEDALKRVMPIIADRRMLGTVDHPDTPKISLTEASHIITDLKILPDGTIIGECEVLDTPKGLILKKLLKAKVKLGVSSRGYGKLVPRSDGIMEVADGYNLSTFDIVQNPSAGSYISQIQMNEEKLMSEGWVLAEDHSWIKENYIYQSRKTVRDLFNELF